MNLAIVASLVLAAPVGEVSPKLQAHADAMAAAAGLHVRYTVTAVGGATDEYAVTFSRPDKARFETPKRIVVSDGETVTVFDRASNTFTKQPYRRDLMLSEFGSPLLGVWSTFFEPGVLQTLASTKDLGAKKLRGKQFEAVAVTLDKAAESSETIYLDPQDMMPKIVDFDLKGQAMVLSVVELSLTPVEASAYAFAPPAGAKEVDLNALKAGEWLHDLDEALKLAKATGKLVMVDFMASWCGPCKLMDKEVFQSAKFKESAGDFVLVKIDVDEQPAIAKKYGVTAMPTVKFLNADGAVVHEFVGYVGPDQVFGELGKARSKKA
jgi:thiol-disulfide isomerase/thioredoxin